MANPVASYAFLPWLRQGIGAQITDKDTSGANDGTSDERATLQIDMVMRDLSVDGLITNDTVISKTVNITGPGDVLGINAKVIVRTEPRPYLSNFENNNLVYIEFYEEDFLWRYTPASPDDTFQGGQRLRPWLSLIVVKADEGKFVPNPNGLGFLSVIPEKMNDVFHDEKDNWAWGHVHLNAILANNNGDALSQEVSNQLHQNPDSGICRLVCPRKLARNTSYTAFLIPSFETGRLAGLGMEPTGIKAQMSSWKKGVVSAAKRPTDFPVYYQWEFKTGNFGDFESLVSILKPIIITSESGTMPMDIQNVGFGLNGEPETKILGFEGALRPTDFKSEIFPQNDKPKDKTFQDKLKKILNLSSDILNEAEAENVRKSPSVFYENKKIEDDDPIIVPPVYGVWHALAQKLGSGQNPAWFEQLNLDPRTRGVAGLGTNVIQQHQDDFVNRAWEQVEQVNEANNKIRQAELAKMIANAIFKKHFITANEDKMIALTHSVHSKMLLVADKTVHLAFKESRIPIAAKSPAFQKMLRPTTTNSIATNVDVNIISNFNKDLTSATLKTPTTGTISAQLVTTAISKAVQSYVADPIALAKDLFFTVAQAKQASLTLVVATAKTVLTNAVNASTSAANVKTEANKIIQEIVKLAAMPNNANSVIITLKKAKYEEIFYDNNKKSGQDTKAVGTIVVQKEGFVLGVDAVLNIGSVTMLKDVQAYQSNFKDFWNVKAALPQPKILPVFAQFDNLQVNLQTKVFPELIFTKRFFNFFQIFDINLQPTPLKDLKPVMAYPVFKEAVYEYLVKISKDFIIPNVNKLEKNSIALLENNPKFIESFMVGLNHEMARELLWREYPTDQRGSYFRQFWSIKDSNIFKKDPEKLLDIPRINEWNSNLGSNGRGDVLVLVIRGEVLQKYPDTMIYAQQAQYDPIDASKSRVLPQDTTELNTKFPLFRAEIEPDITLVGFELTAEEAKGNRLKKAESTAGKKPGWFFVLKQRPGHISFGLDDFIDEHANANAMPIGNPKTWNDLTWEHLVAAKTDLNNYQLTFKKAINPTTAQPYQWNKNSADLAAILFQRPVIFARHAAEMLPEDL